MPGQVVLKGYQIGYRICTVDHAENWCSCAYTDLPMHLVSDYLGSISAYGAAQLLLDNMREDFPNIFAEWRIQECWD